MKTSRKISNGVDKDLVYRKIKLISKDEKTIILIIIIAVLLMFLAAIGQLFPKREIAVPKEKMEIKENIIKKQLRELEELRGEVSPLTQKEIETQVKELEKLRQGRQK